MNYLVEVLWGLPDVLKLGHEFKILHDVKQWQTKDLADQILEVERQVRDLQGWKDRPLSKLLHSATDPTNNSRPSSYGRELFERGQHLTLFVDAHSNLVKPTVLAIRQHLLYVKFAWHAMWSTYYDMAVYFGENPDDLDPPNEQFLEAYQRLRALDQPDAVSPQDVSSAFQAGWLQDRLPGASADMKGKRPDEVFQLFDLFFNYFEEAIRMGHRNKERERKSKEREEKQKAKQDK